MPIDQNSIPSSISNGGSLLNVAKSKSGHELHELHKFKRQKQRQKAKSRRQKSEGKKQKAKAKADAKAKKQKPKLTTSRKRKSGELHEFKTFRQKLIIDLKKLVKISVISVKRITRIYLRPVRGK